VSENLSEVLFTIKNHVDADWPSRDPVSPEGIGRLRFCNSFAAYHILISIEVRFGFQKVMLTRT